MLKILIISILLILVITNCHKEIATDNYNYPKDTPAWLQTKIDSIATINYYALTKVYSYKWKEKYLILNPSPSKGEGLLNSLSLRRRGTQGEVISVYCELYDEVGNRFILSGDSVAQDFMQNKKDKTLIWEDKD